MSAVIVCERSSEEKNAKRWKVCRTDACDNTRREEEQIKLGSAPLMVPQQVTENQDRQHPGAEIRILQMIDTCEAGSGGQTGTKAALID